MRTIFVVTEMCGPALAFDSEADAMFAAESLHPALKDVRSRVREIPYVPSDSKTDSKVSESDSKVPFAPETSTC